MPRTDGRWLRTIALLAALCLVQAAVCTPRFYEGVGNWQTHTAQDGGGPIQTTNHPTDARNRIIEVIQQSGGSPTEESTTWYDLAGNLTFDGQHAYQYDAWNRLLQVNRAHWVTPVPIPPDGQANSGPLPTNVAIDELVKGQTYDGLGRLVRTQSPYPDPETGEITGELRSEHFRYDGIRRIQEIVHDPVVNLEAAGESGDPELVALAAEAEAESSEPLDGSSAPAGFEEGQGGTGGGGGGPPPTGKYLDREYVWGPGDLGVDELLVQYDRTRAAWWPLQDAGADLIALCDLGGTGGAPRVVGQWSYSPYGKVLTAQTVHPHAHPHLGHKALFVDRLDAGIVHPSTAEETPRLAVGADLVTHNRGRNGRPPLGRFLQSDPNATGLTLMDGVAYGGMGWTTGVNPFDLSQLYGDGANCYEYLGGNPWTRSDPLGLSWDPFDYFVDDYLVETAGSQAAFMAELQDGFDTSLHIGLQVAQLHPGVAAAIALYRLSQGTAGAFDLIAVAGPGGRLIGRALGHLNTGRARYAAGSRVAGVAGHEWHHILPKFLGGADNATRRLLPTNVHRHYHRILKGHLDDLGLRSGNWSQAQWMAYIGTSSAKANAVAQKLIDATAEFDKLHGYNLLDDLLKQLRMQGWP